MKTEIYSLLDENAGRAIEKAAEYICAGELVGIPTETVYGLAGSALFAEAAGKIYAAKGRPGDNPLIVHVAEPADAENIAHTTPLYYALAEKYMPGPLTIILSKKDVIPDTVSGGLQTVAIRCPAHPAARELIRVSGHPIAAPSANSSGKPSPTTAAHVYEDLQGKIPLILDGGPCSIGVESTVIALEPDDNGCVILRPGAVTEDMLAAVCGSVRVAEAVTDPGKAGDKPQSPGMKYKHYSPRCQVILIKAPDAAAYAAYVKAHGTGHYGVLAAEEESAQFSTGTVLSLGRADDEAEHARRLFALLRQADQRGYETLYARLPADHGIALAYYNRIIRAAGGEIVEI
ncbi:MAG: threonylcarbamoyl-AMP synthase [Clostridia bacterium]|nr:threonylcarbamoyl-AMP synthase [Clostridia bacterium]